MGNSKHPHVLKLTFYIVLIFILSLQGNYFGDLSGEDKAIDRQEFLFRISTNILCKFLLFFAYESVMYFIQETTQCQLHTHKVCLHLPKNIWLNIIARTYVTSINIAKNHVRFFGRFFLCVCLKVIFLN